MWHWARQIGALAGCVLALWPSAASGQQPVSLSGVIRDDTGAVLPGVTVTLSIAAPEIPLTVVTTAEGRYRFDGVAPGRYELRASLAGFAPYAAAIEISGATTHDIVMTLTVTSERTIVTALKMGETDLQTAPAAITAVSADAIGLLGIRAVHDLAGRVPSLTLSQTPGGRVLATIRGIGTNTGIVGSDPSSTIYLDGVYLGRAAMATADFLDLERVEVLRGPQGTLYGRNSVGGAIHVLTRPPTNTPSASLRITAGQDRTLRAEAAARGPLIDNRVMGSVAILRGVRDGFVKDLDHPDHPLGGDDTWMARGQLRTVFGKRAEMLVSGDYGRFEGVPLPFAKPIVPRPGEVFDSPESPWQVRTSTLASAKSIQGGAAVRLTWQMTQAVTVASLTAYRRSDDRFVLDRDSTELPVQITDVPDRQRQISEELTVTGRRPRLAWLAGAFVFDENDDGPVTVTEERLARQLRNHSTINADARALFGQAAYDVSSTVAVTAGVRYSRERKDANNRSRLYRLGTSQLVDSPANFDMTDSATFAAWTPRLAVQFQVARDRMIYVSATRGFKSGGFNPTTSVPGRSFRPEFAWSHEAGLKQTFAGGHMRANLAAFYNDYRDLQVLTLVATGIQDTGNAASAAITGAEAEIAAVWGQVQIEGSGSWLHATYDQYLAIRPGNITPVDVAGHRLSNAPSFSGHAAITYTAAGIRSTGLFVRGETSWQSRVYFSPFNDAIETQGAYALLDVRAGVASRSRRWDVTLYLRNALNQRFFTGTLNQPTLPAILARPGPPRQWGTQLSIRY